MSEFIPLPEFDPYRYLIEKNSVQSDLQFTYILLFSLIKMRPRFQREPNEITGEVHKIRHRLLELFKPIMKENKKLTVFSSEEEVASFNKKVEELESDETRKMRDRLKHISAMAIERYMDKAVAPDYKDSFIELICDECTLKNVDRNYKIYEE